MSISELQSENKNMLADLNKGYSSLYRWVASDDKELGCKSFHSYRDFPKIKLESVNKIV